MRLWGLASGRGNERPAHRRPHQPSSLAALGAAARLPPLETNVIEILDRWESTRLKSLLGGPLLALHQFPSNRGDLRHRPAPREQPKPAGSVGRGAGMSRGRCCHGGRALGSLVAPRNPVRVECLRYGRSHSSLLLSANAETSRGGRDLPRRRGRCRRPVELSESWLWHARPRRSHVSGVSGSVFPRGRPEREPCP
jgi:hypothetical protein